MKEEEEEGRPGRPTMVGGKWELGSYKVGSGLVTLISPFAFISTLCPFGSVMIFCLAFFLYVPPAVGLILQLLCSYIGNLNFIKNTKQSI